MSEPPPSRWCFALEFTSTSPLIVRTGQLERMEAREGEEEGSRSLIERDAFGHPMIPGSSIKGAARAWLVEHLPAESERVLSLFGDLPVVEDDHKNATGGRLEVHDARLIAPPEEVCKLWRASTAIEPATGTARRRTLRASELAPNGWRYRLTITADGLDETDAWIVLTALEALRNGAIALGADSGSGKGRIEGCGDVDVRCMNGSAIRDWLLAGRARPWQEAMQDRPRSYLKPLAVDRKVPRITLELTLVFDEPLLVSDGKSQKDGDGHELRAHIKEGYGEPYLPGESLRGVLRAQARRIARTVHATKGESDHSSVERLFGRRQHKGYKPDQLFKGMLDVGDFKLRCRRGSRIQEFVAIDRFTGGAADARKFRARAIDQPIACGTLSLRLRPPRHSRTSGKPEGKLDRQQRTIKTADIGLLALILRDLAEGDVRIGSGTTRGYGAVRLAEVDGRVTGPKGVSTRACITGIEALPEDWRKALEKAVSAFARKSP